VDTYDAGATTDCRINLDTVAHDATAIFPGAGFVAANTGTGTGIAGSAKDTIFGFENAFGGNGNDLIYGTAAGNQLLGNAGDDFLFGFGGNDTLDGGFSGNDDLVGGAGKDQLFGGTGADRFHYTALSDSGVTAATRDLIADFDIFDLIDLHLIDANKTNAAGTNDHFNFIGNNVPFTGAAGDLRAYWTAIGQMIEGDVNGDRVADFSIELRDPLHMILLSGDDFFI
jgi:Ca2+-binding RTX toxin-like protein